MKMNECNTFAFCSILWVVINNWAFNLMRKDKRLSEKVPYQDLDHYCRSIHGSFNERQRISERKLLLPVLFGGLFGTCLGMHYYNHKTRKIMFQIKLLICTFIYFYMCEIWNVPILEIPRTYNIYLMIFLIAVWILLKVIWILFKKVIEILDFFLKLLVFCGLCTIIIAYYMKVKDLGKLEQT